MRYGLAVIFICAIGSGAASALPMVGPHTVSVSKAAAVVQAAKRNHAPPAHRHGRADNGIHPLVGSGNY
ncbi:hypothetical protein [Methyloferula stellata]|uniref:hypothetical protein n=1 Tax=Methyloferula stellata TaxID=876270 RepID=UPI0003681CCE|nr:hypothetical protein [Methyloferula stellata]